MIHDNPQTDTQAAINAGLIAAKPVRLGDESPLYAISNGDTVQIIDTREHDAKWALAAVRKQGEFKVGDARSLVDYVKRHGTPATELWADLERRSVLAVLNGNAEGHAGTAGHSDHVARLVLDLTPEWKTWLSLNRKALNQAQFAEHIEDNLPTIVEPTGAELLDLVTTLKVAKSADFESATRLSTGEVQFGYRETQTASAGKKGEVTIPEVFHLALTPFTGAVPYKVAVRFRYRMSEGNLHLTYVLDQPERVLELAFKEVLDDVAADLEGCPLLTGWPTNHR